MASRRELILARRIFLIMVQILGCVVVSVSLGTAAVLGPGLWINPDFAGLWVVVGLLTIVVLPTLWVLVAQEVRWYKSGNKAEGYGHGK